MSAPLEGLRVVDLSRLLPGGFCTLLLADLGADVLKVEEPGKGDYIRWIPPEQDGVSAGHLALNRGKRSMTLNLKTEQGREVFARLAEQADVVVESFRPGVADRLGIGFEQMRARNPGLIWCAITGYGQDGPYRDRAGHDVNYLGYAGVLDIIGPIVGDPVIPGVQIADVGGGAFPAAVGILAALAERARTGEGRFVDISMLDGAFSWLTFHGATFAMTGQIPERGKMRLTGEFACYRIYRAGDGKHITVGALEPQFWAELCRALGVPEYAERQFAEGDEQDAIIAHVQKIFDGRTRDEWMAELEHLDACVGPVRDLREAYQDPQLRARDMVVDVPAGSGTVPGIGNPVRLTGADVPPPRPAPGFGEHTDQVLSDLGYTGEQVADLRRAGVI